VSSTSNGRPRSMIAPDTRTGSVYVAGAPPSKRLVTGQVVKLRAGLISTHLLGTNVSFEAGYGFGFQADETQFVIGDSPGGLQQRRKSDFAVGVNGIKLPLKRATLQLERTPGVRVLSVDKGEIFDHPGVPYPRLNGHPAHLYRLLLSRPKLHKILESPHSRSPAVLNSRGRSTLRWGLANGAWTSC
jgi:hypothetical protein